MNAVVLRRFGGPEELRVERVREPAELYRRGFCSSAVFFPIVPRGEAGLRVMLRADMERGVLATFAGKRLSASRPGEGIVQSRTSGLDADDEVLTFERSFLVSTRANDIHAPAGH